MNISAIEIANKNLQYFKQGGYNNVSFNKDIYTAKLYTPQTLQSIPIKCISNGLDAKVTVYNQDTCECAKRFIGQGSTCILNFASAKNVGGGFLNGSKAQEECICRLSTLYASIDSQKAKEYYEYNRANSYTMPTYSDYTIYSPCVQVFRDTNHNLLSEPYTISAITSPAVNLHKASNLSQQQIDKVMVNREEYILKVAVNEGVQNIVLGAWGCGVFGNKPLDVANYFKYLLFEKGYIKCFKNVSFAVHDRIGTNYNTFLKVFNQ